MFLDVILIIGHEKLNNDYCLLFERSMDHMHMVQFITLFNSLIHIVLIFEF